MITGFMWNEQKKFSTTLQMYSEGIFSGLLFTRGRRWNRSPMALLVDQQQENCCEYETYHSYRSSFLYKLPECYSMSRFLSYSYGNNIRRRPYYAAISSKTRP
jgi:hypothetical protein